MGSQERKVPVLRSDTNLIEQEFDSIREKFEVEMLKMEEEMSKFRSQLIASERDRLVSSTSHTSKSTCSRSSSSTSSSNQQQQQQQQQQSTQPQLSQQTLLKQQQPIISGSGPQSIVSEQRSSTSKTTRASVKSSVRSAFDELNSQETNNSTVWPSSWLNEIQSPLVADSEDGGKILKLRFDVTSYEPEQIIVKTIDNRLQIHAKREETSGNVSMYREYNREFLLPEGANPDLIRSSLSADGVLTVEAPLSVGNTIGA